MNITVDAIRRVRDLVGINLADVTEPQREGEAPLMTRLDTDLILLCDVIYALIKPQADSQNVRDEEFGRALGGDAIMGAHDAFWEALADFFRQLRRSDQVRAIEKQQKLIQAAVAAADRQIDSIQIAQVIEAAMADDEPPPRWAENEQVKAGG